MLRLLDQIRDRVDDETWGLILDFEWRSANEIMTGVEIGLELGYDHGRATAIIATECMPGDADNMLMGKLADLLVDTGAEYPDILLALLATLKATVTMARSGGSLVTQG